ncbi:MAG: AzlC family ABC transporter permease [Desulfovibrionaceae bacterium]|nr:AzlC family ABC transporter permease [Desulfovibrionaceae bacterium]
MIRKGGSSVCREFLRGLKDILPVLAACLPFGFVLGTVARAAGLSLGQVSLMAGLNFAGGSEFAAMELWTSPPNVLLIVAIIFLVNSRLILMGAVLAPLVAHLPRRRVLPSLFLMCDAAWAAALADAYRHRDESGPKFSMAYFLGAGSGMYVVWLGSTTMGAMCGPLLGDPRVLGLDMAFPAVFLSLLKGMWRGWLKAVPWFAALTIAALTYSFIPGAWYVPAGSLGGTATAWLIAVLEGRKAAREADNV